MVLFLTAAVLLMAASAWADSVPIANYSFENPTLAVGGWTTTVPGWNVQNGSAGIYHPTATAFPTGASDGNNVLWVNAYGIVAQTAVLVAPYYNYTLMVDVGQRADQNPVSYAIQLMVGNMVVAQDWSTLHPSAGGWLTSTVTWSTGATSPYFGQALSIRLANLNPGAGYQVNFDNVRFDATDPPPVPEPASLALLGVGLVGLGLLTRRWR